MKVVTSCAANFFRVLWLCASVFVAACDNSDTPDAQVSGNTEPGNGATQPPASSAPVQKSGFIELPDGAHMVAADASGQHPPASHSQLPEKESNLRLAWKCTRSPLE